MNRKWTLIVCVLASLMLMASCSRGVTRVESDSVIDLSGRWNDTDSRLVSEEMIKDALNERWIKKWEEESRVPVIIVGRVTNKSHEHISTETFMKNIERALLNSGRVEFVASKNERDQIREEREDQQSHASVHTRQDIGEETGADLMLTGTITAINDREGKRSVVFYQVNMELVEMETNRKVWIGEKKIKKYVERASTKL